MTNPRADRVRDVARLAGRPSRSRRHEFLAEGPQAARESLRMHLGDIESGGAGVVVELYATAEALQRHDDIAGLLIHSAAPGLRMVTPEVLAAMSSTVTPQGFVAVCRFVDRPLEEILDRRPRLVVVLAGIQDPGNAGTIIRAADAAGADAVILTGCSVDPFNPKTVRSTAGSLFHLPIVVGADADGLPDRLRAAGMTVLAADGAGTTDLDDLQDASAHRRLAGAASAALLPGAAGTTPLAGAAGTTPLPGAAGTTPLAGGVSTIPLAGTASAASPEPPSGGVVPPSPEPAWSVRRGEVVPSPADAAEDAPGGVVRLEGPAAWLFGNEAQGLTGTMLAAADARVRVPIHGGADSLNVGTAATVCLYASARAQRTR